MTMEWRQRFLNAKQGLCALFPGAESEWTPAQRSVASWLRYYDNYYERVSMETDLTPPDWMFEYDELVDAFFVWHDRKLRRERDEARSGGKQKAPEGARTFVAARR